MKRKVKSKVVIKKKVVKKAVEAPKPVPKKVACKKAAVVLDPDQLCARGGCLHPRSIHITGECHFMGCVCAKFIR